MARHGRKRKTGRRHPNGKFVWERGETPAQIAARMPHRRELGDAALDQRAATRLGRLTMLGKISPEQFLAGQWFAADWHAYLATINPPSRLGHGDGRQVCANCLPNVEHCPCDRRRRAWDDASYVLYKAGPSVRYAVVTVALEDQYVASEYHPALQLGLDALAQHYGLTTKGKSVHYQNSASKIASKLGGRGGSNLGPCGESAP